MTGIDTGIGETTSGVAAPALEDATVGMKRLLTGITEVTAALRDRPPPQGESWENWYLEASRELSFQVRKAFRKKMEDIDFGSVDTSSVRDHFNELLEDVIDDVILFRELEPEEDETWESWHFAAFDMLGVRIEETFQRHQLDASCTDAPAGP